MKKLTLVEAFLCFQYHYSLIFVLRFLSSLMFFDYLSSFDHDEQNVPCVPSESVFFISGSRVEEDDNLASSKTAEA